MGKKEFIVLGNGFTIDLLNFIGKSNEIDGKPGRQCGGKKKKPKP